MTRIRPLALAVVLCLALKLLQIILGRFAQLLHQFGDFLIRGTVFHRLGQTFSGLSQTFQSIAQSAIFDHHGNIPQGLRNLVALFRAQAKFGERLQPPQGEAQAQVDGFRAEDIFGPV